MKTEIYSCPGFTFSGCASGLKKNGENDLGLIYSETEASAAGVFTKNRVQAASVKLDRERIKSGKCQAIIANSGNANCCTGEQGELDNLAMTRFVASEMGIPEKMVLVASTGVIGKPLPIQKVESSVPELVRLLSANGMSAFAGAIMTTDTVPKIVTRKGEIHNASFTITGVAKGSGMIRPDMATMLCFVCTDAAIEPKLLQEMLVKSVDQSFNRITVDGDTSTNDMVLLLANGVSGAGIQDHDQISVFQHQLDQVLSELARMVVKDGEGATKLVEIRVEGAKSDHDARCIAETIAQSNLVKTALFGEDANWGRIIAAAGRAGVDMIPEKMDIFFNDVCMVQNGIGCGPAAETEATKVLKTPEFVIRVRLNMGKGESSILTCDFSVDYVKINADYRS
ncbi:MAG: bifunctional glutamate N-acetyltransferase/amino-acid acetyltransferase ArgJ [Deltaproteobacteria bacterium]|nr:MAG: bifunctional glutamate N-acetyltransferase/amino-acid acetyltransferase ArgJ [Deltaproteobacteria bacterium]